MTKKRSLIIAAVAFAALMLPMLRLENFGDKLLCLLFAKAGCVNVPQSLHPRVVAAPKMSSEYVAATEGVDMGEVEMEEKSEEMEPVRLELCLCHPDTEMLTKSLASDGGTITTQAIAAAKSVNGYRLMACERNGEIFEAVYVSEKAEIREADVKSASVERDPIRECYSVGTVLKPEAARRFKELTGAYKPWGKKNNRAMGYRVAIIVNGRLVTAPVIHTEIGATFLITSNFTCEEAMKLAASLNRAGNDGGF